MIRTALAGAAILALSGAAMAQSAAPGSAERNMNNPASVKSNAEKGMPGRDAVPGTGPAGTATGNKGDPRTTPNPAEPTPRR